MAAAKRKKEGLVAFAAGVIAAPLVGVAAVAFVVGVGLIWYASRDDAPEPEDEFVLGFAEPDDIQATEIPGEKRTRRRSQPRPRSTSPSPRSPSPRSSSAPSPRSSSSPSPSSDTPAMPTPPELQEEGSLRPGSAPPADGEVVDIADLEPDPATRGPAPSGTPTNPATRGPSTPANPATRGPAPSGTPGNPFAPPEVAAADPEPERTRTRSSSEPGPHEFPEDDGDSWIPDTFRGIVESGVAMLTGAPAEADEAPEVPAMPDASAEQAQATTGTDDGDEGSEDGSDGVAAVSPEPSSERTAPTPGATPRPEEAASVTPTGRGEPDASVVPETSAMPAAETDDGPMPFAPVAPQPTPIPATRGPAPSGTPTEPAPGTPPDPAPEASTTFDDLVSGGLDMVTGKGAPVVAPAPTRTRTRTEMEEDVAGYTDPVAEGAGTAIELEDDLSVDIEEHDEAASFGTPTADDEVDITEALELDDIVIPVKVQTATPGVPVRIDGKDLGVSPARSDLSDGDHTVVVGAGADATTFTITPMANPDVWCFDTKSAGGYRQVPCD